MGVCRRADCEQDDEEEGLEVEQRRLVDVLEGVLLGLCMGWGEGRMGLHTIVAAEVLVVRGGSDVDVCVVRRRLVGEVGLWIVAEAKGKDR